MAQLEHDLGVAGSCYFRVTPEVWDPGVMENITALGHELGYHYEDLAIAKGDLPKAMAHFETRLAQFRHIYPVTFICMHGSSLSRHDNRVNSTAHLADLAGQGALPDQVMITVHPQRWHDRAVGQGAGVAECEEHGEKSWGQVWLVGLLSENFGGQACVIVVIGG